MPEDKKFLKNVLLFKDLPDSEIGKVAASATVKKFPKHTTVFREGDEGDALFIIKQGLVKISKGSQDGRIKTLAILKPGDIFGEMSVLTNERRTATAETLLETRCMHLDKVSFITLHKKNPGIGLQIIRTLIERLTQANRQIKNLALGNSRAKIADILLVLFEEFGEKGNARVNVKLTHQELADLAGLARETTTKLLNDFAKAGAIGLADKAIEITDIKKLREWVL
jgi:CRP/FNR family cyclic AMP-dependent transcriptional regulator